MSNEQTFKILIPEDVNRNEVEIVVDIYRRAISERIPNNPKKEVEIVESGIHGAIDTVSGFSFLLLTVPASWLASKWIDEFLWPPIKERIDRPSKAFVEWIFSLKKIKSSPERVDEKNKK